MKELELKVSKKQMEALKYLLDTTTTDVGYWGAAGGGKSYIGVSRTWMMAKQYPGTRWFWGRRELTNLKKTTLATYYKFCADYELPTAERGNLNSQDNIITFTNGSQIYLLDLAYKPSDPLYTRFGSMEFTGGFVDESNEVDAQCLTILSTRIGRQRNREYWLKPKLLQTFNPDKWHVYADFYKPRKSGTLPEGRIFIPALATDNPHIDPNYIDQLKKADEITKQRLLHGNFDYDDTTGKLFRYDEILDLFTANIEFSDTTFLSVDVARLGNDSTVIAVWRGLECIRIIKEHGKTTDQTAERVKELEREYWVMRQNIVVDTDGLGAWVADQLRGCYNFHNASSPIKTEQEERFGNLKTQCYFKLREKAEKREVRINADGEIKDLLCQELENIMLKNPENDWKVLLESKEELKRRIGRSPDSADAIMMRMVFTIEKADWPIQTYKAVFDTYE